MKRIIGIVSVLLALVLLAACDVEIEKPTQPTTEATEPATVAPTQPAPTETVKPCVHQWELNENKPHTATCTQAGLEYYICTLCKEEKTEDTKPLGHHWEIMGYVSGDCATGILYDQRCATCWATRQYTTKAGEHTTDWENPGRTVQPTCTADGFRYAYCTTCGHRSEEILPATGHTPGADGLCTVCGEK